jgi:hypothetical protein
MITTQGQAFPDFVSRMGHDNSMLGRRLLESGGMCLAQVFLFDVPWLAGARQTQTLRSAGCRNPGPSNPIGAPKTRGLPVKRRQVLEELTKSEGEVCHVQKRPFSQSIIRHSARPAATKSAKVRTKGGRAIRASAFQKRDCRSDRGRRAAFSAALMLETRNVNARPKLRPEA